MRTRIRLAAVALALAAPFAVSACGDDASDEVELEQDDGEVEEDDD